MEAARRLDEWRVLSKKIPSTDMIPEFVVQEHREGQINLNTSEWLILSKIDGQRSIKAIAAASGPLGLRRGQDPLRPDRHRPHPPARAGRGRAGRRRRRAAAGRARGRRARRPRAAGRGAARRVRREPGAARASSTACATSATRCSAPSARAS